MIRLLITLGLLSSTTTWAIGADLARGCFARVYDRAHLARHPDQIVMDVKLHIVKPHDYFALRMRVRGRNEALSTTGYCYMPEPPEPPGVNCIVECDGGSFRVVPHANHAMMYLDWIRIFPVSTRDQDLIAVCAGDLPKGSKEVSGGKDDRVFRLSRVADRMCAGVKP